ncbi:radical SAM protein [Candidatus Woesearchaeota archaeon]|nr:MAG: radical SAM protein [Candidatus Woesearchaeota archaeon]
MVFDYRFLFTRKSYFSLGKRKCIICGKESRLISKEIKICVDCLRKYPEQSMKIAEEVHKRIRKEIGLPPTVPRDPKGIQCTICGNRCMIPKGGRGYCGVIENRDGKITPITGSFDRVPGLVYLDPHPTNCVAEWFCPGATGRGYPKYSLVDNGPERGYYNIAVFYGSCNFDCLFCQNWEYRNMAVKGKPLLSIDELVSKVSRRTTCVCFFGGDPGPNIIHALKASREMIKEATRKKMRVFRICWETNGLMNPNIVDQVVELSLETGGIIKIDVKAWTPSVYYALTGNDGRLVFENIKRIAKRIHERPEVPLLTVSTLLVPGYVDEYEVENIARFLAELDPEIPYTLLAFHPEYKMLELPTTSRNHAYRALEAAKRAGLKHVSIGNIWLLSNAY